MRVKSMIAVCLVVLGAIAFAGCGWASTPGVPDAAQQRASDVKARVTTFQRAEQAVPVPRTVNFPLRRALAEMTVREDELNHPWYVYILGMNGNIIGYYVAKTVPINACDFLSSTEDVWTGSNDRGVSTSQKMTAPSLDGIYYGGGGSQGGCDAWVFFDSATNALITIRGVGFFSSDQPLKVDAQPIKVAGN